MDITFDKQIMLDHQYLDADIAQHVYDTVAQLVANKTLVRPECIYHVASVDINHISIAHDTNIIVDCRIHAKAIFPEIGKEIQATVKKIIPNRILSAISHDVLDVFVRAPPSDIAVDDTIRVKIVNILSHKGVIKVEGILC